MTDEGNAPEEAQEPTDDAGLPPVSGLDQEEFGSPSGRYLALFGVVGALVGLAIGIWQDNVAFGMAVGLALGVGLGLLLNMLSGR